ncbi:MAG: hypothetical protein EOQ30_14960 [Mesorhizobium sp.]|nr:MAG: hypothetical protein EOQ29_07160 [Mesorhizobium sp.]RWA83010.1 MAG: hypothetical protein EOQ30_14960 [Mesorhizobium sp.]
MTAISPLEGGDVAEGDRGGRFDRTRGQGGGRAVGALRARTPSGLPAISPSRGEITRSDDFANLQGGTIYPDHPVGMRGSCTR